MHNLENNLIQNHIVDYFKNQNENQEKNIINLDDDKKNKQLFIPHIFDKFEHDESINKNSNLISKYKSKLYHNEKIVYQNSPSGLYFNPSGYQNELKSWKKPKIEYIKKEPKYNENFVEGFDKLKIPEFKSNILNFDYSIQGNSIDYNYEIDYYYYMTSKIETNDNFFNKLNHEMVTMEKKYMKFSEKFNPFKKYIHDAFFSYIKNTIEKFELKCNDFDLVIYGSNSTGLGIETSDLDFAILGLEINSLSEFLSIMDKLEGELKKITFVKDSTSIKTANVPILKLV